jgi:hypothetical protein
MTNLIPHVDYQLADIDYDTLYLNLLRDTFDTNIRNSIYLPLWEYIDYTLDEAAKCEGLLGGNEPIYETIEDFCISHSVTEIPALYNFIFRARGGFLTQDKVIYNMRDEWNERFPFYNANKPNAQDPILIEYKKYIENKKIALNYFNSYIQEI